MFSVQVTSAIVPRQKHLMSDALIECGTLCWLERCWRNMRSHALTMFTWPRWIFEPGWMQVASSASCQRSFMLFRSRLLNAR